MKYIGFFVLAFIGWNSWGKCGQGRYQQLQWKIQNYQGYSDRYKASKHRWMAYCQMEKGTPYWNPREALKNFRIASDQFGDIKSNYLLARYLLTGGWGQNTTATNKDEAIWEFEKTLQKINAVFADYPNTDWMTEAELAEQIYPGTLVSLISAYTNKYLREGYEFYSKTHPSYYDNPGKAIQRNQANKIILDKLEAHIESCLADHEGQNMMTRARRFSHIDNFNHMLTKYKTFYFKVKETYCPHYKTLLMEIKKREDAMFAIALNCTIPPEKPTEDRPSCSDIKVQTEEFAEFFTKEWKPNDAA